MREYLYACIDCGLTGIAKHKTRIRCDKCNLKAKYSPKKAKPRVCLSCQQEFIGKTSQRKCNDCRNVRKTSTCKICQKKYFSHKSSKIICKDCINSLVSRGKIWCVDCGGVVELEKKLYRNSLRCQKHRSLKIRQYNETAKKNGKGKSKGPQVYVTQTLRERNKIADAFESAFSYTQIRSKLKVTQGRIKSAIASGFASPPIDKKKCGRFGWLSSTDLQKLMSWDKNRFQRIRKYIGMVEYGVIRKEFGPACYVIRFEDFDEFLQKKEFWMLWSIEKISDKKWRDYCRQFRDDKDYWLNILQISSLVFYDRDTVCNWVRSGKLPGTFVSGRWYVWSRDLKEYMIETHSTVIDIPKI